MKLALLIVTLLLSSCMRLDSSALYVPEKVGDSDNLMKDATDIPAAQIEELTNQMVSADGTLVSGYLLKHDAADGTPVNRHGHAILYCHGQTGHVGKFAKRAQELWRLGYNVLLFDYHGYGKTKGKPTEDGLLSDTAAARDYLETRFSANNVALYGWSLGTAFCGQNASRRPPKVLILETPFTSTGDIVHEATDLDIPGDWFLDSKLDLVGKIGNFTGSLLVFGGTKDSTTPIKFARRINEAAKGHATPNELVEVDGANHVNVPCGDRSKSDRDTYGCFGGFTDEYKNKVAATLDAAFGL